MEAAGRKVGGAAHQAYRWMCLLLFVIGLFFSAIIPPFQSPDEFDHIKRAYLLGQGRIVLYAASGNSSGGMIDTGLSAYFAAYTVLPFKPDRKLSSDETNAAKGIRWTGLKEFSPAPGTAYYFPLIYLPQAIGLAAGELLGLTVEKSYYLARSMALAAIAAILFFAFNLHPPNPLTIALLIMPMSLFQLSSASLDGVSTALAILALAAFLRLSGRETDFRPWHFYALVGCVTLVTASRIHLLPLWALVLMVCLHLKKRKFFLTAAFTMLLVLAWLAIAIKTTVDPRPVVGASTSSVALFYARNPLDYFEALAATLSNVELAVFYRDSFIGVLGWLDTRFSENTYYYLSVCIALIGLLSISFRRSRDEWVARASLLSGAIASILLVFFALLITWNPHPAQLIHGVQGRYFLVPALMVSYALSGRVQTSEGVSRRLALALVLLLAAFTIFSTPRLLIDRYFRAPVQPVLIPSSMRPSVPLAQDRPIPLLGISSSSQQTDPQPLVRIGILFGTYARKNPGSAELRLFALDGRPLTIPFDLAEVVDNQYKFFELDSARYSSGQIAFVTGGGVSTWEVHKGNEGTGLIATCLIFRYASGAEIHTRDCPPP